MAEAALITISDIQTYRRIDPKYDTNRLTAYVNSVQRRNLRDLLGDALYYAFMASDRASGIYKDLMDGKDYTYGSQTVKYYGLKPVIAYWTLAVITREGELYHSDHGSIEFIDNPQQQFAASKNKERIATMYMEEATRYANEVIQYLNTYSSSYPLWKTTPETNEAQFVTFKI